MRRIVAVMMMGAALGLVGCGKTDTKTYSDGKGNNVSVSNAGDHMTITGSNGEKVEFGTGASAKMPAYLPLYPGAKVTASFTGQGKDGSGGMVSFHCSHASRRSARLTLRRRTTSAALRPALRPIWQLVTPIRMAKAMLLTKPNAN